MNVAKEYPAGYVFPKPVGVQVRGYREDLLHSYRPALFILQLACIILWMVACANVTGLMLVRNTVRQRELAVRQALGASRRQLAWNSLTESLVLSFGGALIGLALASLLLHVFQRALLRQIDIVRNIHIHLSVVGSLVAFSIVTALAFGLVSAWLASRGSAMQVLQQSGVQSTGSRSSARLRDALIVGEIALSLVLLVACGLLLRTLYTLRHVPLGIRTAHIITADLSIPTYRYQHDNLVTTLYRPLLSQAEHLPDVIAASLSTTVPLQSGNWIQLMMFGHSPNKSNAGQLVIHASLSVASADMQKVFGFRMLRGRFFNAQDTATSQPVAVVNRAFAGRWWPGKNPIGQKFLSMRNSADEKSLTTIIGVIDDLPQRSLASERGPQVMLCLSQLDQNSTFYNTLNNSMELALRTEEEPAAVIPEVRTLLSGLAPELRGAKIETMDQVVEDSLGKQKLAAHLLEIFGGTALLITLIGLYGSLLYMVSLRNREMAIRLALGAQRSQITQLVMARAGGLLATGLTLGIVLSYGTAHLLRSYLYGIREHDTWTMAMVCTLFAVCAACAAFIPARRAASTDPMEALRAE